MKFCLLLFLSCGWLTFDVAMSDGTLQYTLNEAGCAVTIPNDYVESCFLSANDDEIDEQGLVQSIMVKLVISKPIGNESEFSIDVKHDGIGTGISMRISVCDLVLKGDALTDEFCEMGNIPKGKCPIEKGEYGNDNHKVSDGILPMGLPPGTYNITITLGNKESLYSEMFILAYVFG